MDPEKPGEGDVRQAVSKRYTNLAKKGGTGCCSGDSPPKVGQAAVDAFPPGSVYSPEELNALPPEVSDISAGCGNPLALAGVKPGEVILDLGSGGGIDVFLAAVRTGKKGLAIGVDATPDMVWRARRVALENSITNVEFRLGEIEHLPVENGAVDLVISNCVINLSPDKDSVFKEAYRVLKPGGRLAVSDIVTLRELPPGVRGDLQKWSMCISGAIPEEEYLEKLRRAGFIDVEIAQRHVYDEEQAKAIIEGLGDAECDCSCRGPGRAVVPPDIEYANMIASDKITAKKPV